MRINKMNSLLFEIIIIQAINKSASIDLSLSASKNAFLLFQTDIIPSCFISKSEFNFYLESIFVKR